MAVFFSGQANGLEALTVAELYARIGHAGRCRADAPAGRRSSIRAELEHQDGQAALSAAAVTEAIVLLSILVDCGDASMAKWLQIVVSEASKAALSAAVRSRPTILKFVEFEGPADRSSGRGMKLRTMPYYPTPEDRAGHIGPSVDNRASASRHLRHRHGRPPARGR
ncbi:hypothetical protein AB5I41_28810 [Sphingomonas sp. MMS24-JH45]